ncbi:glycoside hydrolase family 2 protein [candidate division KSB1 bacterium]|nr:glycoside hydrolase family 2 protein [candidate division KSB1 bacterium]
MIVCCGKSSTPVEWPEMSRETKPWTRWWWMGSVVNKTDLAASMEQYQKAGLGGLEITPIYGVMGYEDKFIDFLSPDYIDLLSFTLQKADRLDIGIDMATGTGWPFGGPWIGADFACKNVEYKIYHLKGGESLDEPLLLNQEPMVRSVRNQIYQLYGMILRDKGEKVEGSVDEPLLQPDAKPIDISRIKEPISANANLQALALEQVKFKKELPLQILMAYSQSGTILNLTSMVEENGILHWTAPPGEWTLYALFQGWHGKMVERAAPGGEGNVIDHFSKPAIEHYLAFFDTAFAGMNIKTLRAFFNDSYEVDDARGQADWTPSIFEEFRSRRGYDLEKYLPALFGRDSEDNNIRVLSDFRETISDLLLEKFTNVWREWAHSKNAIIRNQAHGSPANILDLYAASDIPETEGTDLLRIKFASSAAHVTGKKLTSSESATWLDEHFLATLADVKTNIDRYLLGGVNHVFYHGTTYSPQEEKWPGWIFYASVHFGPTNSFWADFAALNHYVSRCQSFLQSGKPDNDVLLYFPFHDRLAVRGRELLEHFTGGGPRYTDSEFRKTAQELIEHGYSVDYISDSQLMNMRSSGHLLQAGGAQYKAIILPECRFIPLQTFKKLIDLTGSGAAVIINNNLPTDVPGFSHLDERRSQFKALTAGLNFKSTDKEGFSEARVGQGKILLSKDIVRSLEYASVNRETMVDRGLYFIRRKGDTGSVYFIKNAGENTVDDWVPISKEAKSVVFFNPDNDTIGKAAVRQSDSGGHSVYLQLNPGESCILRTYNNNISIPGYPYFKSTGSGEEIDGTWTIRFLTGGPELPEPLQVQSLGSWTDQQDKSYKIFSGTAEYSISFPKPAGTTAEWQLDLGIVKESADVSLNGKTLGTIFSPPYTILVSDDLLKETNSLIVNVSNLMANRIADMDRRDVLWKKFYNINFPARRSENRDQYGLFTAARWSEQSSGLLGPVKLIPVERIHP